MSAKAAAAPLPPEAAAPKGKSKMLVMLLAAVLLVGGAAGGAWFFLGKKHGGETVAEEPAAPAKREKPTYLPLENMVVNLADPGGERFAQIGLTLDLENEKAAEEVKAVLPSLRSQVLMLVSQRSSEELLKRDGKEKLADDIVAEISRALGYEVEAPAPKKAARKAEADSDDEDAPPVRRKKRSSAPPSPVHGVLFSSFIVQ